MLVLVHSDVAGFEPSLRESCGCNELLLLGGVVADQPLGQQAFVDHPSKSRTALARDAQERLQALLVALCNATALGVIAGVGDLTLGLLEAFT